MLELFPHFKLAISQLSDEVRDEMLQLCISWGILILSFHVNSGQSA
jgi:hypothetical protein